MKKKHLYLKATDAYSIFVMVRLNWKVKWDREVLLDSICFAAFDLKLNNLINKDLNTRLSVSDVLM